MNKRLTYLEQVATEQNADPFALYALALEYQNLERHEDALLTFTTLRSRHPNYVAMYLMCGQLLAQLSRKDDAREWFDAGKRVAQAKGDAHTLSELESAAAALNSNA